MIVGFTINDFNGYEKEAVEFINKVCILESPDIAQNIVNEGPGINIFASGLSLFQLQSQPFSCTPIETQDGKYMVISAVNFKLELLYNNSILVLWPTEYTYIDPDEINQFEIYEKQNLIKCIPKIGNNSQWILAEGDWDDFGIWLDDATWKDYTT